MKAQFKKTKKQTKFLTFNESETKKNYSVSIVLYAGIIILAFMGMSLMFNWYREFTQTIFMRFKNFTILSNIFMGLVAIMMVVILAIARKNQQFKIPKAVTIINLIGTTCVALTMIITVFMLAPGAAILGPEKSGGQTPISLFQKSNLVFHLVLPTLSIFACLCYAKTGIVTKKDCLWSLIPILAYLVLYVSLAYTHINPETGKPFPQWDTYKFCQFGPGALVGFAILVPGIYVGLVLLIRLGNQRIKVSKFFTNVLVQSVIILLVIGGAAWVNKEEPWETFKYFTNLSAFLFGIATIIYLVYICLEYKKKIQTIPTWVSSIKLSTTAWVFLTFCIVVFMFAPITEATGGDHYNLFHERDMLFHVFVPLFGITSYIMLEHNKLNWKHTFYVLTFSTLYIVVYVALAYSLRPQGVDKRYCDWYSLYETLGPKLTWLLIIANPLVSYGLGFLLWYLNRRVHIGCERDMNIFDKKDNKEKLIAIKQPAFAKIPLEEVKPAKKNKKASA